MAYYRASNSGVASYEAFSAVMAGLSKRGIVPLIQQRKEGAERVLKFETINTANLAFKTALASIRETGRFEYSVLGGVLNRAEEVAVPYKGYGGQIELARSVMEGNTELLIREVA